MEKSAVLKNILIILLIVLMGIVIYFTYIAQAVIVPIIFSFITAFILHPVIIKLTKIKIPYWISAIIVYLLFLLFFITIITILIISLINLFNYLPLLIKTIQSKFNFVFDWLNSISFIKDYIDSQKDKFNVNENISEYLTITNFNRFIITPMNLIFSILRGYLIFFISLIFIIPIVDIIPEKILIAFKGENGVKINNILKDIIIKIQNYVFAKFIVSLIVGIFSLVVCFVFKIKFAFLWAILIFLLNFIPFFGTFIALTLTILMHFIQYQSVLYSLLLYVSLMAIQVVMENIVQPKIISDSVNLSPIIIITSILVWGYIWGFSGILLAVPITSIINIIFNNVPPLKPLSAIISAK